MRLFSILFFVLSLGLAEAQTPQPAPPSTDATTGSTDATTGPLPGTTTPDQAEAKATDPTVPPLAVPGGVNIHWYGHGFIYLTSSVGIRAAIDPFGKDPDGNDIVHYKFPVHLSADMVLVTHEAEDHCGVDRIFGNPLIFRSVMAVGLQRANGIPFYGVALQKDPSGRGGSDTAFLLDFDGVKFCYLGQISQPLLTQEKAQLGKVDVLFLPVGLKTLSVGEMNQVATDLGAKIIIPINYKTDLSGILELRTLDEYLDGTKFPVRKFSSEEIAVTKDTIPHDPTVYVLKPPTP